MATKKNPPLTEDQLRDMLLSKVPKILESIDLYNEKLQHEIKLRNLEGEKLEAETAFYQRYAQLLDMEIERRLAKQKTEEKPTAEA